MQKNLINRICLGTVQFGLDYGVANKNGRMTKGTAFAILGNACASGITTLDTATSYGQSEELIGEFTKKTCSGFRIISKTPYFNGEYKAGSLQGYFDNTLRKLDKEKIYGYLVHDFNDIVKNGKELWRDMEALKGNGRADKIGISIYSPKQLEYIINKRFRFDIVQLPYSIFDQRFKEDFPRIKDNGGEIYARSVFLQGLSFLSIDEIIKRFSAATNKMGELNVVSSEYNIPVYSLCLGFVLSNALIDKAVIGVDSLKQLKKNVSTLDNIKRIGKIYRLLESLELKDENILLPFKWNAR